MKHRCDAVGVVQSGTKLTRASGFRARSWDRALALSLITGLLATMAIPVRAQTFTWSAGGGASNPYWSNPANWSPVAPNSATADAVFSGSASLSNLTARLDNDFILRSLTFNNGTQARAFTINATESNGTLHDYGLRIGSGGITNNTALTQTISALIYLTANQSFTTVSGGTLSLASSLYNQVNLQGNTLTIAGAGTTNIQSNIVDTTGGGSLVKSDTGVLTLTGANTYTGTTTINGGTLNVGTSTTSSSLGNGTGAVTINGGILAFGGASTAGSATITNKGTLQFWDMSTAKNSRITNTAGSVQNFMGASTADTSVITNSGTVYFQNTSTASGATIVNNSGGVVDLSLHTGDLTIGRLSGAGDIYLGSNSLNVGGTNTNDTISGGIRDGGYNGGTGGNLFKNGTGTLTLSGTNTFTGYLLVNAGTVVFAGNSNASASGIGNFGTLRFTNISDAGSGFLTNNGTLSFRDNSTASNAIITNTSGSTLDISQHTDGITIAQVGGNGNISLGGNALTLGGNNADSSIGGIISGTGGSLIKTGTGNMTLSGTNTYTGGTVINGGTLTVPKISALSTGQITNNSKLVFDHTGTATLDNVIAGTGTTTINHSITLTGANTFTGNLIVQNGAIVNAQNLQAGGAGTITVIGGKGEDYNGTGTVAEGGSDSRLLVSQSGMTAVKNIVLQGGNGGNTDFEISGTGGQGGKAAIVLDTHYDLSNINSLTLIGGNGGARRGPGFAGDGADTTFELMAAGALPNLTTLKLIGGTHNSAQAGNAQFTVNVGANNLGSQATVLFQRDESTFNDRFRGEAIFDINGNNVRLGGIETYGGIVHSNALLQNSGSTNATLTVGNSENHSYGGIIQNGAGTGVLSLVKAGTGTQTLNNTNTYTGTTTITGGTLLVNSAAALGSQGVDGLSLSNGATGGLFGFTSGNNTISRNFTIRGSGSGFVTVNASDTLTVSGILSSTGNLTIDGPGTIILSGNNTYSGGTMIAAGTLVAKRTSSLGTGTVTNNAALILDTTGTGTIGKTISGSGTLTKTGTGTVTLTGNNNYSGDTTLQGGTLALGSDSAVGPGRIVLDGGTLQASDAARTVNNAVTLVSSSVLSSGTVTTSGEKAPGLTLAGAVALSGDGGLNVTGDTRVAITGVVGEDSEVRPLIKEGSGTLVLTNDNTYTGGTLVRGGTLIVNNAYNRTALGSGTGEGAVTIGRGATLTGTYAISGPVRVNNGASLGVGNSIGASSVGDLSLAGGSFLDFEIGEDGFSSDHLEIAGLLSHTGSTPITFRLSGEQLDGGIVKNFSEGTFTLLTFGSQSGLSQSDFYATGLPSDWNSAFILTQGGSQPGTLSVTLSRGGGNGSASAPEPGTLALILVAGGGAGFLFAFRARRIGL